MTIKIQRYSGRRVSDGSIIKGYVAIGAESKTAFILVPNSRRSDQFHIVEVAPESIKEWNPDK